MGMMRAAPFVLLGMFACSAAPESAALPEAPTPTPTAAVVFNACTATLTPAAEIADLAAAQIAEWNAATGCSVQIGEGGIPVELRDEVISPETGKALWGYTDYEMNAQGFTTVVHSVAISQASPHRANTLRHEFGHLMGVHEHTQDGLMAAVYNGVMAIDSTALVQVCEHTRCLAFNPEIE
jgi:hypothetical protein